MNKPNIEPNVEETDIVAELDHLITNVVIIVSRVRSELQAGNSALLMQRVNDLYKMADTLRNATITLLQKHVE